MFEPYKTTYGSLINISNIVDDIRKYVSTNNTDDLEYEYPVSDGVKCVYITGYNDEEKELPVWEHPLVTTNIKGETIIVSDVRKFIRKIDELPARLEDDVKDSSGLNFTVLRALLLKDFLDNRMGKFTSMFKPMSSGMGVWISGMVNTVTMLDPLEKFNVEIIVSMYANTLFYDKDEVNNNIETIIARVISSKHVYNINKKEVRKICDSYVLGEDYGLKSLIVNIQNVLGDKGEFVTIDSLIGVMGNVWYGPGGSETPIIALEDMSTWMTLVYSVITNRSYNKSRIGTLITKHNRVIDSKQIEKYFDNYIKEIKT